MWEDAAVSCLIITKKNNNILIENVWAKEASSGSCLDAVNGRESGNSSVLKDE